MKYLRSTTLGYKDIEIRKSEFVAKTQFLYRFKQDKYALKGIKKEDSESFFPFHNQYNKALSKYIYIF